MVRDRLQLHDLFETILGSSNVYFQPPSSMKLLYPCIIYKLDDMSGIKANNARYLNTKRYFVTHVDRNPDTIIPDRLLNLQYCEFENHIVVDNLNHYMCSLYW